MVAPTEKFIPVLRTADERVAREESVDGSSNERIEKAVLRVRETADEKSSQETRRPI